jgi:zinc protease
MITCYQAGEVHAADSKGATQTTAPVAQAARAGHNAIESIFPPPLDQKTSAAIVRSGKKLPVRPEQLPSRPFNFTVPEVQRSSLPNGIRLYTYAPPYTLGFYAVAVIDAGSVCDPADKVGLAELTARALRSGGAGKYGADDFDRRLDELGADLSVNVQRDNVVVDLFVVPANAPQALELFAQMLTHPRFEEQAIAREKSLMGEKIVREADDPSELSRREFRKIVYGTTHPLGRSPLVRDVQHLRPQDVRDFYRKFYRPDGAWIGVAAAETTSALQQLATDLGGWQATGPRPAVDRGSVPADRMPVFRGTYLLEKDIEQVVLRAGHFGKERNPDEQPVVDVLNNVYGAGGLTSRLMQEVRTAHGLAYGVGGGIFADQPVGLFVAAGSTKAPSASDALALILKVTSETLVRAPSRDELETARRDALFSFTTRFSNPRDTVFQYIANDFYGYPADYLARYPERVQAVTAQDVLAAARRYIDPDRLTILVVGRSAVRPALEKRFGAVSTWSLSDAGKEPAARSQARPARKRTR